MASRILNRHKLRLQADQAAQPVETDSGAPAAAGTAGKKKAAAKAPKPRKPRKLKTPPRLRARWGLFDGSMKQVAIFDYRDRIGADEKLAALLDKKKGSYFLQIVKDEMPEPMSADAVPAPL
jgi:hypothetical protein